MSKICGIYKITSPSGRVYIGQSVDIKVRWRSYRKFSDSNKGQILLNNSFNKYTVENHTFEIIEECLEEDLNCRERYWQDFYNVLDEGLNLMLQECGEQRRVLSEETLKRKSEASKGEKNGMFGRVGELNPNFRIPVTEERKRIQSELMKGRYEGELNPFYGKEHSEEIKKRLSDKGKQRIGELNGFYGKTHTEECKKKNSERSIKFFEDNPEIKQYLKEHLSRGYYHTPVGIFISQKDAAKANGVSRCAIKSRCIKNSDKKVGNNYQTPEEYRGEKTWKEHGWFFEAKNSDPKDCTMCSS